MGDVTLKPGEQLLTAPSRPAPAADDGFTNGQTPSEKAITDALYDNREPLPREPGEFYSVQGYLQETYRDNVPRLLDAGVLTVAQAEAEQKEFAGVLRETGLDPYNVGRMLHDEWTAARLAYDDVDVAAQAEANAEASRKQMREKWGAKDSEDLLARSNRWIRQHPKLNAILTTGGIGSKPAIVDAIAEHVRNINFR